MLHFNNTIHRKTILSYFGKLNKVKTIISNESIIKMKAEKFKKYKLVQNCLHI